MALALNNQQRLICHYIQRNIDMYTYTHTHTHTHTHIYIYIYIYIVIHRQTVLLYHDSSVARHVGRLKLGLKLNQFYVRLSIIRLSQQVNYVSLGIIRYYVIAFVCLHLYLTEYQSSQFIQRALLECSTPMSESIYCHPKTDCFIVSQLFSVARHVGCLKLGLKPFQLYVRLSLTHTHTHMYMHALTKEHLWCCNG